MFTDSSFEFSFIPFFSHLLLEPSDVYSVWCGICRILICIRPCYFIFYTDIQSLKWQIYFLLDPRALVEVLRTTAISKFSRNILWYYWMPVWSKIEQNFLKFILDLKHKKVNIEHSWCDVLSIANYDLKHCHFKVVTHPPPLSLSLSLASCKYIFTTFYNSM